MVLYTVILFCDCLVQPTQHLLMSWQQCSIIHFFCTNIFVHKKRTNYFHEYNYTTYMTCKEISFNLICTISILHKNLLHGYLLDESQSRSTVTKWLCYTVTLFYFLYMSYYYFHVQCGIVILFDRAVLSHVFYPVGSFL